MHTDFINKLFNSYEFVEKALTGYKEAKGAGGYSDIDLWLLSRLNTIIKDVEKAYEILTSWAQQTCLLIFTGMNSATST